MTNHSSPPKTFPFLRLPVELQFIVLEKFFEEPWRVVDVSESAKKSTFAALRASDDSDFESTPDTSDNEDDSDDSLFASDEDNDGSPNASDEDIPFELARTFSDRPWDQPIVEEIEEHLPPWYTKKATIIDLAPLQVSYQIREIALKAIRNMHAGELEACLTPWEIRKANFGLSKGPRFFDRGITTLRTDLDSGPCRLNKELVQYLRTRFVNLSTIKMGVWWQDDAMQLLMELNNYSGRLDRVLARQVNTSICAAAMHDVHLSESAPWIGNIKIDFTIHFSLFSIVGHHQVWCALPRVMKQSNVWFNFEVYEEHCRITNIGISFPKHDWDLAGWEFDDPIYRREYEEKFVAEGQVLDAIIRKLREAYGHDEEAEEQVQ